RLTSTMIHNVELHGGFGTRAFGKRDAMGKQRFAWCSRTCRIAPIRSRFIVNRHPAERLLRQIEQHQTRAARPSSAVDKLAHDKEFAIRRWLQIFWRARAAEYFHV